MTRSRIIPSLLLALVLLLPACSGLPVMFGGDGGSFAIRSEDSAAAQLSGSFSTAVYSYDDKNTVSVILLDGPEEAPTQAVHIRMFWTPKAGKTPIDPAATNASISYLVFSPDAAGRYGGAGFLYPRINPGSDTFAADLRSSAIRLLDSTPNYSDKVGLATATGGFTARRDDAATLRLLHLIQSRLAAQLGYPAFVTAPLVPPLPTLALAH
jgi:hypothetical protein